MYKKITFNLSVLFVIFASVMMFTQTVSSEIQEAADQKNYTETLSTLESILAIKNDLQNSLNTLKGDLKSAVSDTEKQRLQQQVSALEERLLSVNANFDEIATNVDASVMRDPIEKKFDLEEEIVSLIKPTLEEMNHMTEDVRKKSELRKKLEEYATKLMYIKDAIQHLDAVAGQADENKALQQALQTKLEYWKQQQAFYENQQQSTELQLKKLTAAEVSFTESTQNYLKAFFQKRGFYLFQALVVILTILFVSRFSRFLMLRYIPGFKRQPRQFRTRLLDLLHHVVTVLLLIIGPMVVFYLAEDWVLFSLSILLLIGVLWTLRTAIPQYWSQIQLFLNVGSVREGERIYLENLPWRVKAINIYTILENPIAGIQQRISIRELVDMKSRPYQSDEPWFPCKKGDWVILADNVRGKVIGISHEMVKLSLRGGAQKTYLTSEFLALSPLNLSVNFRVKETIGISYKLQAESTHAILETLQTYLEKRLDEEGYTDDLLNLRVEFQQANESSLDIVVIADFKGHLGDVYNRIKRAIQRWCVDACTENNWEIPFPQMTLHHDENV
jgi:predicted nuclease with TOPRIM domain